MSNQDHQQNEPLLLDEEGRPLLLYHGSPVPDIESFEDSRTAHGIFFTPDPETAGYYATGRSATIYAAHLVASKLADFDCPKVFEEVMREAIDFTLRRDDDEALTFAARLYREGYHKNDQVRAWFDEQEGIGEVDNEGYTIEDLLHDNVVDASDVDELVESIGLEHIKKAYDEAAPEESEELDAAREAYGSQVFYMEYQDDFMRAAQSLGYDAVVFSDPSSTGECVSYVIFRPEQVRIVAVQRMNEQRRPSNGL